ncbi:MAG: hypothetical protein GY785_04710 [Gammaproteobacteria bacterium]|nr:hypothetical protein [Gammaproteobacteria bacterium]MCP4982135.1 hypothetical protein [Gammaproteobacteria bacterium]
MKGNSHTRNTLAVFALVIGLGLGQSAQATVLYESDAGSTFGFGGLTWTADFSGFTPNSGEIEYIGPDPTDVTIRGSSSGSGFPSNTGFSTTAGSDLQIDFSWAYETFDIFGEVWDTFFWVNSGAGSTTVQLSVNGDGSIQSGAESMLVAEGDVFGFSIFTVDNWDLPADFAEVNISNFSYQDLGGNPNPVPVPPAFLLFGSALAGLGFMRKKKQTTA